MKVQVDNSAVIFEKDPSTEAAELLNSDYTRGLKEEMASLLEGAIGEGSFTREEVDLWYQGIDACEKLEHLESLRDFLYEFIDSGNIVVFQLGELLKNELFTSRERVYYTAHFDSLSYEKKNSLIGTLKSRLEQLRKAEKELSSAISWHGEHFSARERALFFQSFYEASGEGKEKLVAQVGEIACSREKIKKIQKEKAEHRLKIVGKLNELAALGREDEALNLLRANRSLFEGASFFQYEQRLLLKVARREMKRAYQNPVGRPVA